LLSFSFSDTVLGMSTTPPTTPDPPPLTDYQRGILDGLSIGSDLDQTVIGFVESELARNTRVNLDEIGIEAAHTDMKGRWRNNLHRLAARVHREFVAMNATPATPRVAAGRTYRLPEPTGDRTNDDAERTEWAHAQNLAKERSL
jgi:hypothetical protein